MRHQKLSSVSVFCGSSSGSNPEYRAAARKLGAMLAEQRITLVYGGGNVGLMGELADAALAGGGQVIGVIPHGLSIKELAHEGATKMHVVDTMHDRKALMADLSDASLALPGGLGTLEEIFEVITWGQLGIHQKPCGFLNVAGYYDQLIGFLDYAAGQQFIKPEHRATILVDDDHSRLLERMRAYEPPAIEKWIRKDER